MSDTVNTAFVPDMQRKLYRWSTENPEKVFSDLFNLVCDRRTLDAAWRRLAHNKGSQTPGTDGMTRKRVRATHGVCRAWRAGCRETRTSGSARGMERLALVRE